MTKLELFLILSSVDYLKQIIIPETNILLKHPMKPGEFIWWLGCWFYMGFWVRIFNRWKWWSIAEPKISGGAPFRLDNYMSSNSFEEILGYLSYKGQKDVEYYYEFLHMRKMEEAWNLNIS